MGSKARDKKAAYSLLGIFEASMLLIYGEDRKKALTRLYSAYKEFSEPSPALVEDSPAYQIVSFKRNPNFTSRNSELSSIKTKLFRAKNTAKTIIIIGLRGIRKTQLVLELFYQIKEIYKSYLVI